MPVRRSHSVIGDALDHGGRYEVYRLADELSSEIDHLLPIVDAEQLLGFATLSEGTAAITATGVAYADADGSAQREIFRGAATVHIILIRQIVRALAARTDHSVPEEFFHDMLDEQFSKGETVRQLETAVSWERYSRLLISTPAGAASALRASAKPLGVPRPPRVPETGRKLQNDRRTSLRLPPTEKHPSWWRWLALTLAIAGVLYLA